jgi:NAD-dependent dihydropyrimidine dehydrogenase PreA subunit
MAYEIVKDICEGESSCVDVCPVDCIKKGDGENTKGTGWYLIVAEDCVSCNACLEARQTLKVPGPYTDNSVRIHMPCRGPLGPRSFAWGFHASWTARPPNRG